jgi:predicted nucleotidyltransferase
MPLCSKNDKKSRRVFLLDARFSSSVWYFAAPSQIDNERENVANNRKTANDQTTPRRRIERKRNNFNAHHGYHKLRYNSKKGNSQKSEKEKAMVVTEDQNDTRSIDVCSCT